MSHPAFSTRPDYQCLRKMSLPHLREAAAQALQSGHLNLTTLWLHRQCWLHSQASADYLNYLLCRRQFGYAPHARHQHQLRNILQAPSLWLYMKGIRRHQQNQLQCLLNEAQQGTQPAGPQHKLAGHWLAQQTNWQKSWLAQLKQATTLHVVGNSPHILGLGLGEEIDSADVVVRFNHFQSKHTSAQDIGTKLSAWVAAPGYQGPVPLQSTGSQQPPLVIAGPAMLYLQQRFNHLTNIAHRPNSSNNNQQVLQVPLNIWRQQVRLLAAPPSAGALLLAWLLNLKQQHQLTFTLRGYGFGYDQQEQTRYHIAKPDHRPVARHNWSAEHQWMRSILTE